MACRTLVLTLSSQLSVSGGGRARLSLVKSGSWVPSLAVGSINIYQGNIGEGLNHICFFDASFPLAYWVWDPSVELTRIDCLKVAKVLHSICQKIWKIQQWPQGWKRSVFIPISKKDNAQECSNYCTIALISHASKVMLKILQVSLQ